MTQATVSVTVPNLKSGEALLKKALEKLGLPSSLQANLTHEGKPLRLSNVGLREAGLRNHSTLTLISTTLPGGVYAINDNDYQSMKQEKKRAAFTHNQIEDEQRQQKEEDDADDGFFSFKWLRSDKGIPYEWAQPLDKTEVENFKLKAKEANEQAMKDTLQDMILQFKIPQVWENLDSLHDKVSEIERKAENIDFEKKLVPLFERWDDEGLGQLNKDQFRGFLRQFCDQILSVTVSDIEAEQIFEATDINGDKMIQREEIIRKKLKTGETGDTESDEETFIEQLPLAVQNQQDKYEAFLEELEVEGEEKEGTRKFFLNLEQTNTWFQELTQQQKYLLQAILTMTIKDENIKETFGDEKYQLLVQATENITLRELLNGLGMEIILLVILTLTPKVFRQSIEKDGPLSADQIWLLDIVEDARHRKFIKMISTAVDQAAELTPDRVSEALSKLFAKANVTQKKMLLQITDSYYEREIWLSQLQPKEVLALIRQEDGIDYVMLQLCPEEMQKKIERAMSSSELFEYTVWKSKQELCMSDKTFADFDHRVNNHEVTRSLQLLDSQKVYNQIKAPGQPFLNYNAIKGVLFMQIEYHKSDSQYSFARAQDDSGDACPTDKPSGWYFSFLEYDPEKNTFEKLSANPIDVPLEYMQRGQSNKDSQSRGPMKEHQKIFLYLGNQNEVFFFTRSEKPSARQLDRTNGRNTIQLNILSKEDIERGSFNPDVRDIYDNTTLYDFATQGPDSYSSKDTICSVVSQTPTLIRRNVVVFPMFRFGELPKLVFYHVSRRQTIELKGATALLYDYGTFEQDGDCIVRLSAALMRDHGNTPAKVKQSFAANDSRLHGHRQMFKEMRAPLYYKKRLEFVGGEAVVEDPINRDAEILAERLSNGNQWQNFREESAFSSWLKFAGQETGADLFDAYVSQYQDLGEKDGARQIAIKIQHVDKTKLQIVTIRDKEVKGIWQTESKFGLACVHDYRSQQVSKVVTFKPSINNNECLIAQVYGIGAKFDRKRYARAVTHENETKIFYPCPQVALQVDGKFVVTLTDSSATDMRQSKLSLAQLILNEAQEKQKRTVSTYQSEERKELDFNIAPMSTRSGSFAANKLRQVTKFDISQQLYCYRALKSKQNLIGQKVQGPFDEGDVSDELEDLDDLIFENLNANRWQTTADYPLFAFVDSERPQELNFAHLTNGIPEQVSHSLNVISDAPDQADYRFLCFAKTNSPSLNSEVHFIAEHIKDKKICLYSLILEKSFLRTSLSLQECWSHRIIKFENNAEDLYEDRNSLKEVFFFRQEFLDKDKKLDQSIMLVYQTDKAIKYVQNKGNQKVKNLLDDNKDLKLSQIYMIQSQSGHINFVVEEMSSQTSIIMELFVNINETTNLWNLDSYERFNMTSGHAVVLQFNRTEQQLNGKNLLFNGKPDETRKEENTDGKLLPFRKDVNQLYVITTDMNLLLIGTKGIIRERNLQLIEEIGKSLDALRRTPFETMTISERTIVFRDKIFSIGTGKTFDALRNTSREVGKIMESQPVQYSDKVLYKFQNAVGTTLIFKNDPGRRDCNMIGYRAINSVMSATMISQDMMLFQMARSISAETGEIEVYWTGMSLDERIQVLPRRLHDALENELKKEGKPCLYKHLDLCTKGVVNQLLVVQPNVTVKKSKGQMTAGSPQVLVIDLLQDGNLLRKRQVEIDRPEKHKNKDQIGDITKQGLTSMFKKKGEEVKDKPIQDKETLFDKVLQNCNGDLVHVACIQYNGRYVPPKPKYIPSRTEENKLSLKKTETLQRVELVIHKKQDNVDRAKIPPFFDVAYTGDYICWKRHDETIIHYANLTTLKQLHGGYRRNRNNEVQKFNIISKTIDLDSFMGKKQKSPHLISIDPCDIAQTMVQSQRNKFDEEIQERLENLLEVTIENRVLLFDLNGSGPRLLSEQGAVDQIIDPQEYVEFGVQLTYVEDRKTREKGDKYGHHTGGKTFASIVTLAPTTVGDMIVFSQRSLQPMKKLSYDDVMLRPILGIYKEHAEIDVLETIELDNKGKSHSKPKEIDMNTLLAVFGNQTLFSVIQKHLGILEAIREKLAESKYEDEEDDDETPTYNPFMRKLACILLQKTSVDRDKDDGKVILSSLLSDNLTKSGIRDAIIKIGRFSPSFQLLRTLSNQDEFQELVQQSTPSVIRELNSSFYETKSTRQVTQLDWPRDLELLTMRSSKATIDKDELNELLKDHEDKAMKAIKVRMINLEWLYRDNRNFVSFCTTLDDLPGPVYSSEFISCILDQYWKPQQRRIILTQFVPYAIFAFVSVYFMVLALQDETLTVKNETEWLIFVILGSTTLVLWANQVKSEIQQLFGYKSKIRYLLNFWNWFDIIGLATVFVITVTQMCSQLSLQPETIIPPEYFAFGANLIDIHTLRLMAAYACFNIVAQIFNWLRLFEGTAFYIMLLVDTLRDVQAFLVLIVASLTWFGLPMVMLNLNRDENHKILDGTFGHWIPDMLLNQYFLALGEFNYANFADQPQAIVCYALFLLATFFSQITMLNMLIAIMGDSFERVTENREVNSTKIKLNFMKDMAGTVGQRSSSEEKDIFMFVARPEETEMLNEDEWDGSINKITAVIKGDIDTLGKELQRKNDRLQATLEDLKMAEYAQNRRLKENLEQIIKSVVQKTTEDLQSQIETVDLALNKRMNDLTRGLNKNFKSLQQNMVVAVRTGGNMPIYESRRDQEDESD